MKYSCEHKKQCVELYRQGKWPETPEGVSADRFHHAVVEWHHLEKACGTEALRHKKQNKVWTAEEKYELVAKVLADASYTETTIAAGIDSGLLYRWVRCYKMKGHAVDVRHLQQFTDLCSTGFFFRASILSGHIFSSILMLLFYTSRRFTQLSGWSPYQFCTCAALFISFESKKPR